MARKSEESLPATRQSQVFLDSEGDAWFRRNEEAVNSKTSYPETETIKRVLGHFKDDINRVLEVGCANGAKLFDLCSFFEAEGFGVDPSKTAVKSGQELHKHLNFAVSTASNLPHLDNSFDLVFFGFCLYLVDRNDLLKAVSEADRVLKAGGYLAILDFDPKQRHSREYHHRPGLHSYKSSYANFFTAGGHYYLVAKDSYSHEAANFSVNSDERVSLTVLYKEVDPY